MISIQVVTTLVLTTQSFAISYAYLPPAQTHISPFSPTKRLIPHKKLELQTGIKAKRCNGESLCPRRHYKNSITVLLSTAKQEMNEKEQSSKEMSSLHFIGEKKYLSDPVPIMHNSQDQLSSFFAAQQFCTLLLNGNGDHRVELLPDDEVDEVLYELWTNQCSIVGGEHPIPGDSVFMVKIGGINFTGLNICLNSLIGVKYLEESSNDPSKPEYQIVFIKDSQFVEGPKVLVWIYNKLTGKTKKEPDCKKKNQNIHSLSRFTYEITPDGKSLMFAVKSKLEVVVKFPSFLLKILPVSKEKAEEQGSASVMKAIGKDLEAVLPKCRNFYCRVFEEINV